MSILRKSLKARFSKITGWLGPYLEGIDGEPSSKRLIGVFVGVIFGVLCLVGGVYELKNQSFKDFKGTLEVAAMYSGGLLGIGAIERRTKSKRNTRNKINDEASIINIVNYFLAAKMPWITPRFILAMLSSLIPFGH